VHLKLAPERLGELGERVPVPRLGSGQQLTGHVSGLSHGTSCLHWVLTPRKRKWKQGEATWLRGR